MSLLFILFSPWLLPRIFFLIFFAFPSSSLHSRFRYFLSFPLFFFSLYSFSFFSFPSFRFLFPSYFSAFGFPFLYFLFSAILALPTLLLFFSSYFLPLVNNFFHLSIIFSSWYSIFFFAYVFLLTFTLFLSFSLSGTLHHLCSCVYAFKELRVTIRFFMVFFFYFHFYNTLCIVFFFLVINVSTWIFSCKCHRSPLLLCHAFSVIVFLLPFPNTEDFLRTRDDLI